MSEENNTNAAFIANWKSKVTPIVDNLTSIFEELELSPENRDFFIRMNILLKEISDSSINIQNLGPELNRFCQLMRIISKYAVRIYDAAILNICVAILYDGLDIIKKIVKNIIDGNNGFKKDFSFDVFATRVRWLKGKIKGIENQLSNNNPIELENDIEVSLESMEKILCGFET